MSLISHRQRVGFIALHFIKLTILLCLNLYHGLNVLELERKLYLIICCLCSNMNKKQSIGALKIGVVN